MKQTDAAWAAGIIDGEGCITIDREVRGGRTYYTSLRLQVGMTHLPTLERLQELFGGKIRNQPTNNPRWKQRYIWGVRGPTAVAVLRRTTTYMTTKKAEADLGIEYSVRTTPSAGGRGVKVPVEEMELRKVFFDRIKALKH